MAQLNNSSCVTVENPCLTHRHSLCVVNMCINTPCSSSLLARSALLSALLGECSDSNSHQVFAPRAKLFCLPFSRALYVLQWQIFKEQLHTRVVLVAVEIWTERDHIPISVKPLEMLRDFSKYRQQSIKHHADAVHLIS